MKNETEKTQFHFSSGLPSFDEMICGIHRGDNIVWQVDDIEEYKKFVIPFTENAQSEGKKVVYFRFAQHEAVVPDTISADRYEFDPEISFELFLTQIIDTIEKYDEATYFVFDSLSDLAADWSSDRMLGCFFMLVCPFLFRRDTAAYFVLLRNYHGPLALDVIYKTAQVVLEIYSIEKHTYILPIKASKRNSPTLYMLHSYKKGKFEPERRSFVVSKVNANTPQPWLDFNIDRPGIWTNILINAKRIYEDIAKGCGSPEAEDEMRRKLIKMIITRDQSVFDLSYQYLSLNELLSIAQRMVGTGLVGGKSVGMLLAHAIIRKNSKRLGHKLETHDSFFVGSDVFYTYIIQNDCWWHFRNIKRSEGDFEEAEAAIEKILNGKFPGDIREKFIDILKYYGQAPIIVRSSSLLEDAYGNAFSGKYESYFLVSQGTPEQRLEEFLSAIKKVYASTMSQNALAYRYHKNLLKHEERMALLVQRVSGRCYDKRYFPQIAGVGYSFNPYVWNSKIKPSEGVLRLVFGLGTRAVDQHSSDHTRIVALNEPLLRPEANSDQVRKYTQRIMDLLDFDKNTHTSSVFREIAFEEAIPAFDLFASKVNDIIERAYRMKIKNVSPWILNFDNLLTNTRFVEDMRQILKLLETAYKHPVDIEFTANFDNADKYCFNIVQCRPFHFKSKVKELKPPGDIPAENLVLKTTGPLLGQSTYSPIDKIIYIEPMAYSSMPMTDKYATARLIGDITNAYNSDDNIMLMGPGRWGTTMPTLGITVSFNEIKNVSVLCELVSMHENLNPDISLGTHFFNDLVEMQIMYIAINQHNPGNSITTEMMTQAPNHLLEIVPRAKNFTKAVYVINTKEIKDGYSCFIHADTVKQHGVVFLQ